MAAKIGAEASEQEYRAYMDAMRFQRPVPTGFVYKAGKVYHDAGSDDFTRVGLMPPLEDHLTPEIVEPEPEPEPRRIRTRKPGQEHVNPMADLDILKDSGVILADPDAPVIEGGDVIEDNEGGEGDGEADAGEPDSD